MVSSPKHPTDAPATSEAEGRDRELRAWMAQYGPGLRRFLLKRVSPAEADDIVQDVFIALRARQAGGDIQNVEGYLFRTAVNVIARQKRRRTWQWGQQEPLEAASLHDPVSPERILLGKEGVSRVVGALAGLPSRSAEAFFLSRFEQLTNEEVAQRMGVSVKAVEELMRRALNKLLDQLETER